MTGELHALRAELVARIRDRATIGESVADALRTVPRHVFLPHLPPESVYRDEAIVTRRDEAGRPTSSSSQPAIMAIMLDQLGVAPGQRVLEIGAGTGYNAALLAHLAGPTGEVVTVDLDPDLVDRARTHLTAAGYPGVHVVCADGAGGFAPRAPYDRVIATVGVWDLAPAWLEQLDPAGRLVVPLDLRGVQRSVAFERAGGHWASVSVQPCGFMRMRGPFAGPEQLLVLDRDTERMLTVPHDRPIDLDAVRATLSEAATEHPTGVSFEPDEVFDGLNLWLAVHEPRWCALGSPVVAPIPAAPVQAQGFNATAGILDAGSLALLASRAGELAVFGYGPDGGRLAAELVARTRDWDAAGRPGSATLHVRAYPRATAADRLDGVLIDKVHTRLALSWTAG
ncbi:MAG TPA: methyltransferase, FxLD system [Actinophytocola sp.]|uniref:methyltransferase, FxLD system n=1 Tax=Actinophytocola sp. TaxID=1872138 RepID=UPI002DDD1261|nr:methyltransferase, FxLD system [Actinophytocola sp.]HEV2784626.1 methyltransferase, FxLD system [Actinophytocola sp.]